MERLDDAEKREDKCESDACRYPRRDGASAWTEGLVLCQVIKKKTKSVSGTNTGLTNIEWMFFSSDGFYLLNEMGSNIVS